jgi:hypothetical protein
VKIDTGRGTPTYVALRRDFGVTLHQGGSRILLAPDELAEVLEAIHELTGQGSPIGAEKTTQVDNINI